MRMTETNDDWVVDLWEGLEPAKPPCLGATDRTYPDCFTHEQEHSCPLFNKKAVQYIEEHVRPSPASHGPRPLRRHTRLHRTHLPYTFSPPPPAACHHLTPLPYHPLRRGPGAAGPRHAALPLHGVDRGARPVQRQRREDRPRQELHE